jgi:hypothetical protein
MVIRVFAGDPKPEILVSKAEVLDFGFSPLYQAPPGPLNAPKYWKWDVDSNGNPIKVGDPYAQIDRSTEIQAGDDTYCKNGY